MEPDDHIGSEIGNYRLLTKINSGSFGTVYKAEHKFIRERLVAIKLLHQHIASSSQQEQFLQEAQFLALLEHPSILSLLDFGFHGHQPYLIARYASGGSLREALKGSSPLPPEQVMNVVTRLGQALHFAHQRHIIHRDLKPENILFTAQGEPLLADFGIATMISTASGEYLTTVSGTPSYMSPEQFRGLISKESDQYALGCIAYELVTGRRPFVAPDFIALGFKHANEPPVPPSHYTPQLPAPAEAAILKAMAKNRGERYPDILTFVTDFCASLAPLLTRRSTLPSSSATPALAQPSLPSLDQRNASLSPSLTPLPSVPSLAQSVLPSSPAAFPLAQLSVPPSLQQSATVLSSALARDQPAQPSLASRSASLGQEDVSSPQPPNAQSVVGEAAIEQQLTSLPRSRSAQGGSEIRRVVQPWRWLLLGALALLIVGGSVLGYVVWAPGRHQPTNGLATLTSGTRQATLAAGTRAQNLQTATVQAAATNQAGIIATAQAKGQPQLLWTFPAGGPIFSSATVVDETVFIGSDDSNLFAVNRLTGQRIWVFSTGGELHSAPTVVNGIVYIGSGNEQLIAIDAATGQQKWAFTTGGGSSGNPVVVQGIAYGTSGDGKLYALDAMTGKFKWSFTTGGPIWSSATYANGIVYVTSVDHKLYAIDARSGQKKWTFTTQGGLAVSPAVMDGFVFIGGGDFSLYALNATTGQLQWSFLTNGPIWSVPTVSQGTVYFGSYDQKVYALNLFNGQLKWSFTTGNKVWSSPAVVNDTVYIGSTDHKLYALSTRTGQPKWSFATGDAIKYSSPTVVHGVVYIGSDDTKLYAIATGE